MPSAENIKQIFSVASLAVLLLSLGAAGTSLGLLQANTSNGASCRFYISYILKLRTELWQIIMYPLVG